MGGPPTLGNIRVEAFSGTDKEVLSEDGTTISWKDLDSTTSPSLRFNQMVTTVTISGILSQRLHGGRWWRGHRGGSC